ncbi:hypothetical protein SZN_15608 [Streptomyces zinciresistens K42]|uniref:Peptidoglycan binding domain-containing protein n=2 Tax=Streptomyces TaxID=1883 RepID=G2GC97_9ACTN|nr:hypothetical protein SZN_15608 [Streptomyces zinciresistens K42]
MVSDTGADAGRSGTQPEERKTETTLTTRIRINIPGSRPIPPVVMRKPVVGNSSRDTAETEVPAQSAAPAAGPGAAEPPAEPAAPGEEKASDWFVPRKSAPGKGGQGGPQSNGAAQSGGSGTAAGPQGPGGGARPGGVVRSMGVPGARPGGPRPGGAGLPGATGGPVAPGHGGGTGSFDVTEALAAGGNGARPGGEARRDDLPYFADNGQGGQDGQGGYGPQGGLPRPAGHGGFDPAADFNAPNPPADSGGLGDFDGPTGFGGSPGRGGPQGPSGPTTGPVTGTGPVVPALPAGQGGPGAPGIPSGPVPHHPGGGLSDDTAILTPQKPATGRHGVQDNVSGDTVTSGIPVVTGARSGPFGSGAGDAPGPHTPPRLPDPAPSGASAPRAPKKKGRSKLALLSGGLIVLAGGLYGAGLLMNSSDVPKGTTVLGVDIGGGTRDDAVKKLGDAFDKRVGQPVKLSVGGKTVALEPDNAGLQFDMQRTVSAAARSDYNPVSVIGSLFGNQRVVDPVMPVDEEKLQAALRAASGGSGSVTEGGIEFRNGKAVAVYGKPGKGIDAAGSAAAITRAYRTQVETGAAGPVGVPTTAQAPTVSNAEVDRMMKEFAQPAMSAIVTIKADSGPSIRFGPVSLPKILSFKAIGGKLVDSYDLAALKEAYGTTFDGVQVQTATGKRGVLPNDVVAALRTALRGKTPAERTQAIETNPT